jgi:hypothetical protein
MKMGLAGEGLDDPAMPWFPKALKTANGSIRNKLLYVTDL